MTRNGKENEFAALDRELAQMARETPEMPDDFHDRWMGQIRAEAARTKEAGKKENRRQWRYVLSAAAVFVFLIGGTLLTRGNRKPDRADNAGTERPAWTEPAPAPAEAAADMGMYSAAATEAPDMAVYDAAPAEAPAPDAETFANETNGANSAVMYSAMNGKAPEAANGTVGAYEAEAPAEEAAAFDEPADYMMEMTEGAAETDLEEAAEAFAASEAEPVRSAERAEKKASGAANGSVPAATAAPTAPPEPALTEAPAELPGASPAARPAEEPRRNEFVSFLKDLGIFTLKTLAAAAACAALAVPAVLIYRKKRKRR